MTFLMPGKVFFSKIALRNCRIHLKQYQWPGFRAVRENGYGNILGTAASQAIYFEDALMMPSWRGQKSVKKKGNLPVSKAGRQKHQDYRALQFKGATAWL